MSAANSAPNAVDRNIAMRPASQIAKSAASGKPATGRRPVQLGIAVSRKPAMTAAR